MTVISHINQIWPDATIDIGAVELTDHFWGIVGSIPYDGHVVLAILGSDPTNPDLRHRRHTATDRSIQPSVRSVVRSGV